MSSGIGIVTSILVGAAFGSCDGGGSRRAPATCFVGWISLFITSPTGSLGPGCSSGEPGSPGAEDAEYEAWANN